MYELFDPTDPVNSAVLAGPGYSHTVLILCTRRKSRLRRSNSSSSPLPSFSSSLEAAEDKKGREKGQIIIFD